jgi:hypothetical protein
MIPANKQNHARRHVGLVLALVGLLSATALIPEQARRPTACHRTTFPLKV